jgi:hypothetical protein
VAWFIAQVIAHFSERELERNGRLINVRFDTFRFATGVNFGVPVEISYTRSENISSTDLNETE